MAQKSYNERKYMKPQLAQLVNSKSGQFMLGCLIVIPLAGFRNHI